VSATLDRALSPPHNLDAEQSVLGGIFLSDKHLYALVIDEGLKPEDFYREQHGIVYRAILDLYDEADEIDHLTVTEHLRETGKLEAAGGEANVGALAAAPPATGHIAGYAKIVKRNALLRRLLNQTYEIQSSVLNRDGDPEDLVDRAQRGILEVTQDDRQKDFVSAHDLLNRAIDQLHKLSTQKTNLIGTPSGFKDIDAITGGFIPGNLIIIAARPSMGKSALVTNIAENAALTAGARPIALFSLEMSEAELAQRFVASRAGIGGEELRRGRVEERRWPKVLETSQKLAASPLWVDDSSDLGTTEIRAKARRLHQQSENGLGLIIIDYLQLMRADHRIENRVQQIGEMSRSLKMLARELDVPVIALSQLSRAPEQRAAGEKRPMLSDLRESGNLEQDADVVMFIYRDEYYNKETEEPGVAEIIIAKHRNGALGTVKLAFQHKYPRFLTYVDEERY
jgi:replicative DNA helicase